SRWISVARPSTFPRELSRCFRWRVEYGSMEYSAVTQPPGTCWSFIQRGTASSTMAEQITRVSPVLTSTEPVAFGAKPGVKVTGRSWKGVRPSCRVMCGGYWTECGCPPWPCQLARPLLYLG